MKSSQKLVIELKKLNQSLDKIGNQSRFMIYSSSPMKFAFYNFIAGVFHSLGSLFATAVIAGIFVYFFSQIDLVSIINGWINSILSQSQYSNILPPIPTFSP
ncbi:TPA: hypothetical protein DD455_00940 [Candidatus Shapirobacteria bacterium]|nr:hypothetical protein [Candidatus Shapirobacteria bacterium]